MTTSSATSDENFVKIMRFPFQCSCKTVSDSTRERSWGRTYWSMNRPFSLWSELFVPWGLASDQWTGQAKSICRSWQSLNIPYWWYTMSHSGYGSASMKRCYIVTSSLIGWVHTQNDPCRRRSQAKHLPILSIYLLYLLLMTLFHLLFSRKIHFILLHEPANMT